MRCCARVLRTANGPAILAGGLERANCGMQYPGAYATRETYNATTWLCNI
jgi:hypothetical protein